MREIAQIIGFFGIVANLLIYQQKTQNRVLLFKLISDIIWAAHYFLLGAFSGAAVACIGILRESVFMLSKKGRCTIVIDPVLPRSFSLQECFRP